MKVFLFIYLLFIPLTVGNSSSDTPPTKRVDIQSYNFYEKAFEVFSEKEKVDFIISTCIQEGIYPNHYLAILKIENPFLDCKAINKNKVGKRVVSIDIGIGQLNSRYINVFAKYTSYDNFDPYNYKHNVEASVKHFKYLLSIFNVEEAVMAYNCGEGAVRNYRIPKSTLCNYLPKWKESLKLLEGRENV